MPNMPVMLYLRNHRPLGKIFVAMHEPEKLAMFGIAGLAHVCVRMLNPSRVLSFPLDRVEAVHGGIGVIRADGSFERFNPLSDVAVIPMIGRVT